MASPLDMPVDSREGIEHLMRWARAHGYVMDEWHKRIARKHGVSVEGVIFAGPLPLSVGKA